MIAEADADLESWISPLVVPAGVSVGSPAVSATGSGVNLHLLALAGHPPLRGAGRPPIQAKLRYLVTAWAPTASEAHRLLDSVLVAAAQRDDVEVVLEALDATTWLAMGIRPQAALLLDVPVRQELPVPVPRRVLGVPEVRFAAIGSLDGVLLGDQDVPVADAEVVLASPRRRAWTDSRGRFLLAGVPVDGGPRHLRVSARGKTTTVDLSEGEVPGVPVIVRIDVLEDSHD
jgi:hypothetical protein